jgi:hypothetical protein
MISKCSYTPSSRPFPNPPSCRCVGRCNLHPSFLPSLLFNTPDAMFLLASPLLISCEGELECPSSQQSDQDSTFHDIPPLRRATIAAWIRLD